MKERSGLCNAVTNEAIGIIVRKMNEGGASEPEIMVALEGVIAGVLVYVTNGDCREASKLMEGVLTDGVARRLALANERIRQKREGK